MNWSYCETFIEEPVAGNPHGGFCEGGSLGNLGPLLDSGVR